MVASVGTYSGPIGGQQITILKGAQLWVRYINSIGGLNGHQVKMLVYDDGGDPARHRAQVQDAVEQKRVIAFVSQSAGVTGGPAVKYITEKRVPVLGSEGVTAGFNTSPMYFPQHAHGEAFMLSWVLGAASQMVPQGKTKLGTLVCAEAQICSDLDRVASAQAAKAGFQVVYRAKSSLAQPDYSAECLAAQRAGAEVILLVFEGTSIARLAASCQRQSYRPVFATGGGIVLDRYKEDPNLEGFVGTTNVAPWTQTNAPGIDQFHRAMAEFGKGLPIGVGPVTGWTSAKLLERGGAALREPPTREMLLEGLWAIKEDTLGGLTMPLTFTRDQPAVPRACWFNLQLRSGAWVSPDAYKLHCESA